MAKLRVGVLFGGRSGEHEVSLVSARAGLEGRDRARYDVIPIGITREGSWRIGTPEALGQVLPPRLLPEAVVERGQPLLVTADPTTGPSNGEALGGRFDVVFPVLHGTFGEDGTVQGLLELADIPYVGSGVLGSAAAMDKDVMKRLFAFAGLPIVPHRVVRRAAWEREPKRVERALARQLELPLFVKPANLGSSVGISKVHVPSELSDALALAASFDSKIVVEHGVDAREIECSVLGNDSPEASLPGEIIPGREFYDYAAKYEESGSRAIVPAKLSRVLTRQVQQLAIRAFQAVEAEGMGRVDFLLERASNTLWVNEINTIPGFTPISMYPQLWAASGLPFPTLLDRLITLAMERAGDRRRNRHRR